MLAYDLACIRLNRYIHEGIIRWDAYDRTYVGRPTDGTEVQLPSHKGIIEFLTNCPHRKDWS